MAQCYEALGSIAHPLLNVRDLDENMWFRRGIDVTNYCTNRRVLSCFDVIAEQLNR